MEITVEEAQRCVGEWVLECRARDRIIAALQQENAALRAQLEQPLAGKADRYTVVDVPDGEDPAA